MTTAWDDDAAAGDPRDRILVLGTRYIGDTVLAIPFLRNLRRVFPEAVIHFHAEGAARRVLADCPHLDGFRVRRRTRPGWRQTLVAVGLEAASLRRTRYARAYLLKSAPSAAVLARLAGIPVRIGFDRGLNRALLTTAVPLRAGRHQADLYLDLLRTDGLAVDDGHNEHWISAESATRAEDVLGELPVGRRVVFVAPCASDGRRNWPVERWADTVRWLVTERHCEIVFAGAPPDEPFHEAIRGGVSPAAAEHVHDFSSRLSLPETTALLARSDACIGVDSGLPHVATACGVPVVKLFGATDPERWGIWRGAGAIVRSSCPTAREPLHGITVAAVRAAVSRVLDGRRIDRRHGAARQRSAPAVLLPAAAP